MKLSLQSRRREDGSAVIVVIAFLAILLIFVAGNLRTLHLLRNDLRLIERAQTNRLAVAGIVTNALPSPNGVAVPDANRTQSEGQAK